MSGERGARAAKGPIDRERLEALVEAGLTIAEIATEVERSKATVRHWLRRYGLKTRWGRGRRPAEGVVAAKAAGEANPVVVCPRHGRTEFVLEGRGYYRCKKCRSERVSQRRREAKRVLVMEAGGMCCICGYDRHPGALEFHHIDPNEKVRHISNDGRTISLAELRLEAKKCVLLCSNCHAEVEAGLSALPLQFRRGGGDDPD